MVGVQTQAAGLVDAFNSSVQQMTMFAPLDVAFQNPTLQVSPSTAAWSHNLPWQHLLCDSESNSTIADHSKVWV